MIVSMWSLEQCRFCKGSGVLGEANGYRIFCEACEGMGLSWQERCSLEYKELS